MSRVAVSSRMRAILATTALLFLGVVAITLFGSVTSSFLSEQIKVHAPRPVLNVLISSVDGDTIYTVNGAPAFTFKDDTSFSPPKGDNDYMKSYPIDGATLVRNSRVVCSIQTCLLLLLPQTLTVAQVSHAHINRDIHPCGQ